MIFPFLMAIGGLGLAAQVVILRELFASFAGNEISAGIFLSVWLVCEGVGAWGFGRLLRKLRANEDWRIIEEGQAKVGSCLALISVFGSMVAVLVVVLIRPVFGFLPGESLNLGALFLVTFISVLFPASTHGALFIFGAEVASRAEGIGGVSRAYFYEGLGTVIAGVLCYFVLLSRISGLGIVALLGGIPLIVLASWFLILNKKKKSIIFWLLFCIGVGAMLSTLVPLVSEAVQRKVLEITWCGQRVLKVRESPYGKVVTIEREGQRVLLYDGALVMSVPQIDIGSVEELVHFPLLLHPKPKEVLVIGGGLAGVVKEVLKEPVEKVTVVELDPILVDEIRRSGGKLVEEELADPRTKLVLGDIRRFLAITKDSFDIILIASAAPQSLSANRVFSEEFFRLCKRRLKSSGFLVTRTPGGGEYPSAEVVALWRVRWASLKRVFSEVNSYFLDFPLIIAGDKKIEGLAPEVVGRMKERGLTLTLMDSSYVSTLLDSFRQAVLGQQGEKRYQNEVRPLFKMGSLTNTDIKPIELFFNMVREQRRSSPFFARLYFVASQVSRWGVLGLVLVIFILGIVGSLTRGSFFARGVGIWTSGFAGAGIATLTILLYQVRFESVYSGVALLLTGFMFGTVPGAYLGAQIAEVRKSRSALPSALRPTPFIIGEMVLVLLSLGIVVLAESGGGQFFYLIWLILAGMCLGWQFAIASGEDEKRSASGGGIAGKLSVLDFTGGALGGMVIAVLVVPLFGLISAALLLAGIKLASLLTQFFNFFIRRSHS